MLSLLLNHKKHTFESLLQSKFVSHVLIIALHMHFRSILIERLLQCWVNRQLQVYELLMVFSPKVSIINYCTNVSALHVMGQLAFK